MCEMRVYFIDIEKKRIVIAGSHGKKTITAMIMHVLKYPGIRYDYMGGVQTEVSDTMAGLSDEAQIAVINGIAWDQMNDFSSFEHYVRQFVIFTEKISPGGSLIYFDEDAEVKKVALTSRDNIIKIPYKIHGYFQNKIGFFAATHNRVVPVKIFGEHNMQSLSAAREVCFALGVSEDDFYEAIKSFEGTA
jgi:UDP-N-acetylmuramate: L-alanyl-gamma-D-glutamyl-meso-diaminopimelate ligase